MTSGASTTPSSGPAARTAVAADVTGRERLRSLRLFTTWTDADLDDLLERSPMVEAHAGDVLVRQGDRSDYAYVVVAGAASVTRDDAHLANLTAGDLFGESAMVAGATRTANVHARGRVQLLRLDAQTVADVTGTQTIAWQLLRSLLDRIGQDERDVARPVVDDVAAASGEVLGIAERIVVAPTGGVFRLCTVTPPLVDGELVAAGQVIGHLEALHERSEITSPFGGFFMGMLAVEGERVHVGQPIAWLRTF